METLEWQKLAGAIVQQPGRIPYEPNKHLFRKVAFDVFQPKSGPVDQLWILEEGEDGQSYLVAQYSSEEEDKTLESRSGWNALADSEGTSVTLLYKNTPIRRFASAECGFTKDDVHIFQELLVEKLATDDALRKKLFRELDSERRNALLSQFPELV